jgi:hypothetical protein
MKRRENFKSKSGASQLALELDCDDKNKEKMVMIFFQ